MQPKFVHTQYLHMVAQSRPVIFNVGEIAPRERFYEPWGRFCGLGGLGGDFSLHRGDFCGLNCTKDLNWFKKFLLLNFLLLNEVYRAHISDWWPNNHNNIVLCNTSLHQLFKTICDCHWLGVKHCCSHEDYECMHSVVFCCVLTLWHPVGDFHTKTTGLHVTWRENNSDAESGWELFKDSKDVQVF